ncbi:energy transducer TonB [Xanthomonas theicola]|uniref:Energy transducer TonB n=1 Tax=Xanthomonas theicola TaxID=56464 RepID=A0A2S6ZE55_9XANT|nr:energy transducer TonB [Xanthomonas theicola]PPT90558.1 energy transducer TonB [Xanthomonas theicola]QNH24753.1 energy transducer TonB [Xanthomonas theicola]
MPAASYRCTLATASCLPLAAALLLGGCGSAEQTQTQSVAVAPTEVAAVQTPPPDYPIELACAGLGGKAVLSVVIGVQGKPTEVTLVTSSGQPGLDASAQQRVREWLFKPATRNGRAVPWTIQIPVSFNPPQPRPDRCFALDAQAHPSG